MNRQQQQQINIQPGTNIAVQQNRPQGVNANQQKSGTQNTPSTVQVYYILFLANTNSKSTLEQALNNLGHV